MYYVYAYFEPGLEKPFYIGKGRGPRAYRHTCMCRASKRRTHFYKKLNKLLEMGVKPQIVLLQENMSESAAFELEKWLITFFKRRCDGGCLCNHTLGGDGGAGYKRRTPVTLQERENRRNAQLGIKRRTPVTLQERENRRNAQLGKKFTEDHRNNISKSHQGIKRSPQSRRKQRETVENQTPDLIAYDPNTGETIHRFKSTRAAERAGFNRRCIDKVLKGSRKTHKKFAWKT